MTLLDNALEALGRGLSVHPLLPRTKLPATPHGSKDRTRDESQVRRWWAHNPNFNVGVNAGVVLDIDRGCKSLESCFTFAKINGVPAETLVIRSGGRRADGSYSAQFHFSGTAPRSGPYESNGVTGEIRSLSSNLYGLYAGSIHPDRRGDIGGDQRAVSQ